MWHVNRHDISLVEFSSAANSAAPLLLPSFPRRDTNGVLGYLRETALLKNVTRYLRSSGVLARSSAVEKRYTERKTQAELATVSAE